MRPELTTGKKKNSVNSSKAWAGIKKDFSWWKTDEVCKTFGVFLFVLKKDFTQDFMAQFQYRNQSTAANYRLRLPKNSMYPILVYFINLVKAQGPDKF